MPRTVEGDTVSHFYSQFSGWSPMRGCHYPKKKGMQGEQKHGMTAIKVEETSEPGDRKMERGRNSAKLKPNHFLYKNCEQIISKLLSLNYTIFPETSCANLGIGGFTPIKPQRL